MAKLKGLSVVELEAVRSKNLDTICFRGSAPLAYLAAISQADIFDQDRNPEGLQRDLSPKHASDAYEYVASPRDEEHPRAFPEVVLNARDRRVLEVEEIVDGTGTDRVRLRFHVDKMGDGKVHVSRVDGNHRLFYAEGDDRRDPLLVEAPFQLHIGLTREQERSLFVDINSNQKGLNTSHLAVMQSKLTPEEREIRDHLDRWIAHRLANDPESPWHGLIHLGGSKEGGRAQGLARPVNFASLQTGVARTLAKSQYIHDLTRPEAQYALIRNFWHATKTVFAQEWASPRDYLLLKNIGVLSISILAGTVIDRCMVRGKVGVEDMAAYLRQARTRFDWANDAELAGMSGNRAAITIAGAMAEELSDDTDITAIRDLQEQLVGTI